LRKRDPRVSSAPHSRLANLAVRQSITSKDPTQQRRYTRQKPKVL